MYMQTCIAISRSAAKRNYIDFCIKHCVFGSTTFPLLYVVDSKPHDWERKLKKWYIYYICIYMIHHSYCYDSWLCMSNVIYEHKIYVCSYTLLHYTTIVVCAMAKNAYTIYYCVIIFAVIEPIKHITHLIHVHTYIYIHYIYI